MWKSFRSLSLESGFSDDFSRIEIEDTIHDFAGTTVDLTSNCIPLCFITFNFIGNHTCSVLLC